MDDRHGKQKVEDLQVDEAESSKMDESKNKITPPSIEVKKNDEIDRSKDSQKDHREGDGV